MSDRKFTPGAQAVTRTLGVACGLLLLCLAAAQAPFQIVTTHLPEPRAGRPYRAQLLAQGGTLPLHWRILGDKPEWLTLDPATGRLAGVPPNGRPFSIVIEVRDAGTPTLVETRMLPTSQGPPLDLEWIEAPRAEGDHLVGSVRAGNGGNRSQMVTVIVEAVNETGKGFALRYDHRELEPGATTGRLDFNVFEPAGRYTVHVDAVGEVAATGAIYRARLEQPGIVVP